MAASRLGLDGAWEETGFLSYGDALAAQRAADALLLLIPDAGGRGDTVLSGKVFEYIAAARPILAAVPPGGMAADLVRRSGSGEVADGEDAAAVSAALERLVDRWLDGGLPDIELAAPLRERALAAQPRTRPGGGAEIGRGVSQKTLDGLFLAAIATVTWEAMRFAAGPVDVTWSDILISLFLACVIVNRVLDRDSCLPRQAATLAGFMLVFLVVYLCGYFDLSTREALAFWTKGIIVVAGTRAVPGVRRRLRRPPRHGAVPAGRQVAAGGHRHLLRLRPRPARDQGRDRAEPRPARRRHADAGPRQDQRHQRLRPGRRHREHLPDQRADRRPQPPRRDALPAAADAAPRLPGGHQGAAPAGRCCSASCSSCRC